MEKKWEILSSEYLLESKWINVRKDKIRMPKGVELDDFYILEYPDWINVVAITEEGNYILERQYRHGTQTVEYEICAGVIEKGEEPLVAARRELYEETGFGGGEWSLYCVTAPNPAAMTNRNYTFLAKGVKRISTQHLEQSEDIDVIVLSREEVKKILKEGKMMQGIMQAPLWRMFYEEEGR
ncbi:MAG: NUDIX hydrolase [Prevotella sp.]